MTTALVPSPRPGLIATVLRFLGLSPAAGKWSAGADFEAGAALPNAYPSRQAMSAIQVNPWLFAAIKERTADLAGLPLILTYEGPDGLRYRVEGGHPFLDLLEEPSPGVVGEHLRRQVYADLLLDGNAYILELAGPSPRQPVVGLERLHPARVTIVPDKAGYPAGYEYDGGGARVPLATSAVRHVRLISWRDDPRGLYGLGVVAPLDRDLQADLAAQEGAARSSKKGRPDFVVSPSAEGDRWNDKVIADVERRMTQVLSSNSGGALVIGGGSKVEQLSWSPRDMEYQAVSDRARQGVSAATSTPPAKLGLDTANYATQREQLATYWQGLQADARLFDAALSVTARKVDPTLKRLRVEHDFSGVRWLQYDRGERLQRVQQWIMLGADPNEAAVYEGFTDAPDLQGLQLFGPPPAAMAPPAAPEKPAGGQEPEGSPERPEETGEASTRAVPLRLVMSRRVLSTEDDRTAEWRAVASEVLDPSTLLVTAGIGRALAAAGDRAAKRVLDVLSQERRAVSNGWWVEQRSMTALLAILATPEELAAMSSVLDTGYRSAVERAYRREAVRLGFRSTPNPTIQAALAKSHAAYMQDLTDRTVSAIVEQGMAERLDPEVIAERVRNARVYSVSRAGVAGQTGATASGSLGVGALVQDATTAGLDVGGIMWLSARDSAVRDTHDAGSGGLDGKVVQPGEDFVSPSGARGPGPGLMSTLAENINCRCTTIAAVA
jgi:phage portal protein BeeE